MSDFINTVDIVGADALYKSIIDGSIETFSDSYLTSLRTAYGLSDKRLSYVCFPNLTEILASNAFENNLFTTLNFAESFPSLTTLSGSSIFANNFNLRTVTGVENINFCNAPYAFDYCPIFSDITLNNTLHNYNPFVYAKRVVFGETEANNSTSYYNYSYVLEFPNLVNISTNQFCLYNSTAKAIIIGENANTVCSLSVAPSESQTSPFYNSSIYNVSGIAQGYIYVPDNLLNSYKTATNWSTIADKIKPISNFDRQNMIDLIDNGNDIADDWDTILQNISNGNYQQYLHKTKIMVTSFGIIRIMCIATDTDVLSQGGYSHTTWALCSCNYYAYNGGYTIASALNEKYTYTQNENIILSKSWHLYESKDNYLIYRTRKNFDKADICTATISFVATETSTFQISYNVPSSNINIVNLSISINGVNTVIASNYHSSSTITKSYGCSQGDEVVIQASVNNTSNSESSNYYSGYAEIKIEQNQSSTFNVNNYTTTFNDVHIKPPYIYQNGSVVTSLFDENSIYSRHMADIFNELPLNVRENISTVKKSTYVVNEYGFNYFEEMNSDIWLFSTHELYPTNHTYIPYYENEINYNFPKKFITPNNGSIWLRDSYSALNQMYLNINNSSLSSLSYTDPTSRYQYVFGFCLG